MHKILIVDDDDFLRQATKTKLQSEGYEVVEAVNGVTLTEQLSRHEVHIVLLDILLDKDNGVELIEEIKKFTDAPIIMVSSKDHLFDKIIALEMGADDYICKPAEPKELLSRAKAHIRRYVSGGTAPDRSEGAPQHLKFGRWILDYKAYSVTSVDGVDAGLTKDEFDLLMTLARSPHVVFTRDMLFDALRHNNYDSFDRSIDIQITRIRKKLGDSAKKPLIIKTVRKVGYQFIAPIDKP